jgi:integrase
MHRKRYKDADFVPYTIYALNDVELKLVLEKCPTPADYIMILLASRYGFRREDIVQLKVRNFDPHNKTITYYEKKKKRDRTIPIESDVVAELIRYVKTLPKKQERLLPFSGVTAWRHLQDICEMAGVPVPQGRDGRPFHSLRGTAVKLRQRQGWNVNECAALIGDDPETVSIYYATVGMSELATKMG